MEDLLIINTRTGEEVEVDEYRGILKEKEEKIRRRLNHLLDNDPDKLTLTEIEYLMVLGKKSLTGATLDFTRLPEHKGFVMCSVSDVDSELNLHTMGMLYRVGRMISDGGRLKYGNDRPVKKISDLKIYLNISNSAWTRHINPDIKKYNILAKETFKTGSYILLNPLFASKGRKIDETVFIAFHRELKDYLGELEYLYLERKHALKL